MNLLHAENTRTLNTQNYELNRPPKNKHGIRIPFEQCTYLNPSVGHLAHLAGSVELPLVVVKEPMQPPRRGGGGEVHKRVPQVAPTPISTNIEHEFQRKQRNARKELLGFFCH